jgi:hypothetical protein
LGATSPEETHRGLLLLAEMELPGDGKRIDERVDVFFPRETARMQLA